MERKLRKLLRLGMRGKRVVVRRQVTGHCNDNMPRDRFVRHFRSIHSPISPSAPSRHSVLPREPPPEAVASGKHVSLALRLDTRMDITVTYKGQQQLINLPADEPTLADLQVALSDTYGLDVSLQKIIYRGKLLRGPESSLLGLGVAPGSKLQLLGASSNTVAALTKQRDELQRREEVIRTRKTASPRSTARAGFGSFAGQRDATVRFQSIEPFPESPMTPFRERRQFLLGSFFFRTSI